MGLRPIRLWLCCSLAASLSVAMIGCKTRNSPERSRVKAQPQNRKIIGVAPSVSKKIEALDLDRAKTDPSYLRLMAWRMVGAVLEPVQPQGLATDAASTETSQPTLPLWLTWYDGQEFETITRLFWTSLQEGEAQPLECIRDSNCFDVKVHEAFAANLNMMNPIVWRSRFDRYLSSLRTPEDIHGLGEVTSPSTGTKKGMTFFSPELVKHYLRNVDPIGACDPRANNSAKDVPDGETCFREDPLPISEKIVTIKATWQKRGEDMPVFDTSPAGIEKLMQEKTWKPIKTIPTNDLESDRIFTMASRDVGNLIGDYLLTGLHVTVKLSKDWFWVSLWWSPEDQSGSHQGKEAEIIEGLGAPWNNYKLCAIAHFEVGGTPTFCSNPYIEISHGHGPTNCIGCHQHAGFAFGHHKSPQVEVHSGRLKQRNWFPGDYLWSFSSEPDNFRDRIQAIMRGH